MVGIKEEKRKKKITGFIFRAAEGALEIFYVFLSNNKQKFFSTYPTVNVKNWESGGESFSRFCKIDLNPKKYLKKIVENQQLDSKAAKNKQQSLLT